MNLKYKVLIPLSLIVLLGAGCNLFNKSNNSGPSSQNNPPAANQNQQNVVTYTDAGFSPKTLTVKKGDTVVFKDSASDDVWVASNPHPIHNGYPTTGGCVASTFDSCSNIAPGQTWSFKFDIVGSWGYHNHLNPSEGGTIVVQNTTTSSSTNNSPAPAMTMPQNPAPTPAPQQTPAPPPTQPSLVSVTISNFAFSPASLTVKKGTAVTWTNQDSVAHTVTGGNGGPSSGSLANGSSYSFTFSQTGTFAYHCGIHPSMTASVTVTD